MRKSPVSKILIEPLLPIEKEFAIKAEFWEQALG
jgi:hypothetical protein